LSACRPTPNMEGQPTVFIASGQGGPAITPGTGYQFWSPFTTGNVCSGTVHLPVRYAGISDKTETLNELPICANLLESNVHILFLILIISLPQFLRFVRILISSTCPCVSTHQQISKRYKEKEKAVNHNTAFTIFINVN
jgi:hypothetical protein